MPEINVTGYKRRIREDFPDFSESQVKRLAKRIAWRVENYTQFVGADEDAIYEMGLRILGIHRDDTARDAVREMEGAAA